MLFLIEYDRPKGVLVTLQKFTDEQRAEAEDLRLKIELDLNRKFVDHEVILLESENEENLRKTHRRYFQDANQIGNSMGSSEIPGE